MDSDPLVIFRAELMDDNQETAIAAASRLCLIALAIGPQRTRDELLRFVKEYIEEDQEEALVAIGNQLGKCVQFVGGTEYAATLLPILEQLAGQDETVVRDAAVNSLQIVIRSMSRADIAEKAVGVTRRLAAAEWLGGRSSAAGLFSVTFPHASGEAQAELLTTFGKLCSDETPLVREAAYRQLPALAAASGPEIFKQHLSPILRALMDDQIDSIRIFAVDACADLSGIIPGPDFLELVHPLVVRLAADPSWKIRQKLATVVDKMLRLVGRKGPEFFMAVYSKLLRDSDMPVRLEAAKRLETIGQLVLDEGNAAPGSGCPPFIEHIGSNLDKICADESDKVRVFVSLSLPTLCQALGSEHTVKKLLPLVKQLAKDENQEVRHSLLQNMGELAVGLHTPQNAKQLEDQVLPMLLDMSRDPKWRVRQEVVGQSVMLARELGKEVFESKIRTVLMMGLVDHVGAIRESASLQIFELSKLWGVQWLIDRFLPEALGLFDKSGNYLHRMTTLAIISHMVEVMDSNQVDDMLLPVALKACDDEVPNVRFSAAKTLSKLIYSLGTDRKSKLDSVVRPKLEKLTRDPDPDVSYFSEQALNLLKQYL